MTSLENSSKMEANNDPSDNKIKSIYVDLEPVDSKPLVTDLVQFDEGVDNPVFDERDIKEDSETKNNDTLALCDTETQNNNTLVLCNPDTQNNDTLVLCDANTKNDDTLVLCDAETPNNDTLVLCNPNTQNNDTLVLCDANTQNDVTLVLCYAETQNNDTLLLCGAETKNNDTLVLCDVGKYNGGRSISQNKRENMDNNNLKIKHLPYNTEESKTTQFNLTSKIYKKGCPILPSDIMLDIHSDTTCRNINNTFYTFRNVSEDQPISTLTPYCNSSRHLSDIDSENFGDTGDSGSCISCKNHERDSNENKTVGEDISHDQETAVKGSTQVYNSKFEDVKKEYKILLKRFSYDDQFLSVEQLSDKRIPYRGFSSGKLCRTSSAPSMTKPSKRTCKVAPIKDPNGPTLDYTQKRQTENKLDIAEFTSKICKNLDKNTMPRNIRSFYKKQNALIENLQDEADDKVQRHRDVQRKTSFYTKWSFFANVILLVAKTTAAMLSGSIAIISSLVDSIVDLASGIVIWLTSRAVKRTDYAKYPQGKKRLEPLAIVILSVIMGIASLQLVKESVEKIVGLANGTLLPPTVELPTIVISVATIVIKFVLYIVCRQGQIPTVKALAQDHRNDVISNSLAIICGYVGSQEVQRNSGLMYLIHVDPIGAITISLYIAVTWYITGKYNTKVLTGASAKSEVINKLTWICLTHHKDITNMDAMKVSYCGYHYQVKACVGLSGEMTLLEANNITTSLEKKLENLIEVDSAFIRTAPSMKK